MLCEAKWIVLRLIDVNCHDIIHMHCVGFYVRKYYRYRVLI